MTGQPRVVLGITGSVSAYKGIALASRLRQAGIAVGVVLTPSAERFVTPLLAEAVSGMPVLTDARLWESGDAAHVAWSRECALLVVAPATARFLAEADLGLAETALGNLFLARRCPALLAPAMETAMWRSAAVQGHVARLRGIGVEILGPESGHLASGETGEGRLVDPEWIYGRIRALLPGPLRGRRVLITAGATREFWDPARFLSSPSSGRMGVALAMAARDLGASVHLVHGSLQVPVPAGIASTAVTRAREMLEVLRGLWPRFDLLIAAAAVADWRPAEELPRKQAKGEAPACLPLAANPDILATLVREKRPGQKVVGFAAQTHNLREEGWRKLREKGLDLIVVNRVGVEGSGFEASHNAATLLYANGREEELPRSRKEDLGRTLLQRAATLWEGQP